MFAHVLSVSLFVLCTTNKYFWLRWSAEDNIIVTAIIIGVRMIEDTKILYFQDMFTRAHSLRQLIMLVTRYCC